MLSAKSSISSNASFATNADDPRPPRLRLSYGMRRKGSRLSNNSSVDRPMRKLGNSRQRCFSTDSQAQSDLSGCEDVDYDSPFAAKDSIDDALENLDIELTEYEKLIMNKYLHEMQQQTPAEDCLDEQVTEPESMNRTIIIVSDPECGKIIHDPGVVLTRFPVAEPSDPNSLDYFPAQDPKYAALFKKKLASSTSYSAPSSSCSGTTPTSSTTAATNQSYGSTGEVRNCRATVARHVNRNQQPNNRSALRKNFSIWVGVTSCVWGLLLYLEKSYS